MNRPIPLMSSTPITSGMTGYPPSSNCAVKAGEEKALPLLKDITRLYRIEQESATGLLPHDYMILSRS